MSTVMCDECGKRATWWLRALPLEQPDNEGVGACPWHLAKILTATSGTVALTRCECGVPHAVTR